MDSFSFCINPIAKLIQDEFNRKMYKKKDFLKLSYLKIDTTKIKVVDITKLATALDKLFAIGGLSINDILTILGREPIEEEWANKRFVTKIIKKLILWREVKRMRRYKMNSIII